MTADPQDVLLDGPWQHRFVSANGARFHLVEAGSGPLVVLLHTAGQFWWAWRHQLPCLADSGHRVVAMDLRGVGGSDKPPGRYDTTTLACDVAGVIRALGESEAVVIGHGSGAWLSWAMPALWPRAARAIGVLSMGHPLLMRSGALRPDQAPLTVQLAAAQIPWLPGYLLRRGLINRVIAHGWGEGTPPADMLETYRRALQLPAASRTALAHLRPASAWIGRPISRRQDDRGLREALSAPTSVPVLQLHGELDPWVSLRTAARSRTKVVGPLDTRVLAGAGHFLPDEAPTAVTAAIREWLSGPALRPADVDERPTVSRPDPTR